MNDNIHSDHKTLGGLAVWLLNCGLSDCFTGWQALVGIEWDG